MAPDLRRVPYAASSRVRRVPRQAHHAPRETHTLRPRAYPRTAAEEGRNDIFLKSPAFMNLKLETFLRLPRLPCTTYVFITITPEFCIFAHFSRPRKVLDFLRLVFDEFTN